LWVIWPIGICRLWKTAFVILSRNSRRGESGSTFDESTFGELLDELLYDRVRKIGATAANEAIFGWLEGHADGCPELCTAFPDLKDPDAAEPLALVYSVAAQDGSRAELNRIDLECELLDAVASIDSASERRDTAARLASRLRAVADKLQQQAAGPEPR
jgi:hypothetical protein